VCSQPLRRRVVLHFAFDGLRQLCNRWIQAIQQVQQIASSPARPRSQRERFQLQPSALAPQLLIALQTFVQRYRLQLIHDSRARLHHAMPMPQQLPQIPVLPVRHPDLRKVILQHQLQNVLRILAIRLLLPPPPGTDLGLVADPQLKLQLGYEKLEPACVSTGLHADAHCLARTRESTVILLRLVGVSQPFLLDLSGRGVEQSDLLKLGMEIYSYNNHRSAPFSRAGWLVLPPPTLPRVREPTLSWNQLHSKLVKTRYRLLTEVNIRLARHSGAIEGVVSFRGQGRLPHYSSFRVLPKTGWLPSET
jgi:hypothetical protein